MNARTIGCLFVVIALIVILLVVAVTCRGRMQTVVSQPAPSTQPNVTINWPQNGARVRVGQPFQVHATATDAKGIFGIAFSADGGSASTVPSAPPAVTFSAANPLTFQAKGVHTITVMATNTAGVQSAPAMIRVVAVQNLSDPVNPDDPPPPAPIPAPPPGPLPAPTVSFVANPTNIQAGQCSTLRWDVEGVREVYFEGVGVPGHSESQQCGLIQTTTFRLQVVLADGSAREYTATVNVSGVVTDPTGKPDLVITDAHLEPDPVEQGKPFNAVFAVENRSDVATGPFTVFWQFHDATGLKNCCSREFPNGLGPRSWGGGTFGNLVTNSNPGTSPSWVEIDYGNRVDEGAAGEGNNKKSLTLTVKARTAACTGEPSINVFTASPATIAPGGSSTLTWDVIKGESIEIDQGIGAVTTPGSKVVSPSAATTYKLTARCGANTATKQVTVNVSTARGPDLLVEEVTAAEGRAPNESIPFKVRVRNIGNANAQGARWSWTIVPAGQAIGVSNVGGTFNLAAGDTAVLNGTAPGQQAGNYVISVTLSVDGDANTANNTKSSDAVRVSATTVNKPDLVVEDVAAPETRAPNEPINFKVRIHNAGAANAQGARWSWTIVPAGQSVGVLQTGGTFNLAAGDTTVLNGTAPGQPAGNYTISVTVSVDGDANTANNTDRSDAIRVSAAAAPLVVTGVSVPDLAAFTGTCPKKVNFSGTITASAAGTVTYHWERFGADGSVEVGGSKTLTFTGSGAQTVTAGDWSLNKSGTYRARLKVDLPTEHWDEGTIKVTCSAASTALIITGVSVSDLANFTGACPKKATFSGKISASGSGTVTYHWERISYDGSVDVGSPKTLTFTGSGAQTVTSGEWSLSKSGTYKMRLKVTLPSEAWDEGQIKVTCSGP